MSLCRWWLIRHAPVINPDRRLYGQAEVETDLSDAAALAALAGVLPARAVWLTTPLSRSRRTAAALAPAVARDDVDFLEQDFGRWQGLTWDGIAAAFPLDAARFWEAPAEETPPGGESFAAVTARVGRALERHSPGNGDVVAVIHAGPIRAALAVALGVPPSAVLAVRIDPLSLTRLDRVEMAGADPVWRIGGVNLPPGSLLSPP